MEVIAILKQILYNGVSSLQDGERFLNRPHIDRLLKEAIQKKVTTVVAGAGYGKTQAVSSFIGSISENIMWLQLSSLDNLIARFWERFIFALHSRSQGLAKNLTSLGYPDTAAAFNQFLRLVEKDLMHKDHFIFVLDDFHLIQDKIILEFIKTIIISDIQNISFIIISRLKPNLDLNEMQSKRLLSSITENDLRFSKTEMEEYYKKQNLAISEKMVSNIYSYAEGWILAIYLVGLSLTKNKVREYNPISSVKNDIFELIEKEIFSAASEELQHFLIYISVLDAIPAGLLDELTQDNSSIVSEMIAISLFVRYDSFADSYQIHHLFREFLLERNYILLDKEFHNIHLKAAKWYENHHQHVEAINHYKECKCYDEIFDIILLVSKRTTKEAADLFIGLIEQAPEEMIQTRPIMLVVRASYLFNNNRIEEAEKELLRLRKQYEALSPTKQNKSILGEVYIMLALISIINQDCGFEELFKMADSCLPDGSLLVDDKLNIAEGINVCGIKNPIPGELMKYREALFSAAPYASRVMNGCGYGMEYLNAADTDFMTGNMNSAEKKAYEAIDRASQKQQWGIQYIANFILVRIYVYKGDYAKIDTILKQMKAQLEQLQISDCISLYDIIEGWFYVKIGELDKIPTWIMHEEETRKMLPPVILGREYLVRSDCLLMEGRYYELLAFMEQQDIIYEARGLLYGLIQNKISKAIIHHYLDNREESLKALSESYELSHANNLIIQYIEYGSKMRTVIQAARQDENCKIPKEWLDNIYAKSSTYGKRLSKVISSYRTANAINVEDEIYLTNRELQILSCVCKGLTKEETADSCNLSIHTVKSMTQNIYSKLGAENRIDAVRIATKMNLYIK